MGTMLIFKTILASAILLLSLVVAMYSTLIERKIAGFFQDRLGPQQGRSLGLAAAPGRRDQAVLQGRIHAEYG